jgi:superfamily II helicase
MTNNKQQTAVEWLFNEFERIDKVYYRNTIIYTDARKEAYEKAKEMEEGAIIVSWHKGYDNQSPMIDENNCGQQYYNKTYGDDKQ